MLTTILTTILTFFSLIPFSGATWFIIGIMGFLIWMFYRANKDDGNRLNWEDLVIDASNERASPYKLGFLIGMIVSTWLIITLADKDKLTYDLFGMWLGFLLGGSSFNSWMKSKTNPVEEDPTKEK